MSPKKFTKEKITKEDGRYVIFYTFENAESRGERRESRDLRPETRDLSTEHRQPTADRQLVTDN